MRHKKYLFAAASALSLSLLLFVLEAGAQCPGPTQRTALLNLQRANEVETTRAGQIALTDTCGNQRYAQYVEINLDTIGYTPTTTGNTLNLSEFVFDPSGNLWYIDWQGNGVQFAAGGGDCDQDWLEIGPASCPDNINDSIYTYKYAAVGARYVWPGATLFVNDSTTGALQVIQGARTASLALYDGLNETWSSFYHGGLGSSILIPVDGNFSISTVSNTPQAPNFEVEHLVVKTLDSLIQFNQYPNTRTDTNAVINFLYTDDFGNVRSQSVGALPDQNGIYGGSGSIPDSTSAEVSFGGFFQIAYPTGVFDPAIRVTDNPPTTARQIDLNSTNVNLKVYPNNVSIEAQDGINMLSNDGSDLEATFFMSPYSVGFSLDSASTAGWTRVYSADEFSEMQATDGGPGGVATIRTYKSTPGGPPNILNSVTYSGATYPSNTVFIDTTGVKIQTFGSFGSTGQVLRNEGGYLRWIDSSAFTSVNIYNSDGTIPNRIATLTGNLLFDAGTSLGAISYNSLNGTTLNVNQDIIEFGDVSAAFNGIGLQYVQADGSVYIGNIFDAGTAYAEYTNGGIYHTTNASTWGQLQNSTVFAITDGPFLYQDNRAQKKGIQYDTDTIGYYFTDSTLVHRGYVSDMIFDSINTNTVQPPAVENIENSTFTALMWLINEVDCSAGAITVDPPAAPAIKDRFAIVDSKANAATNNITIDFTTATQKLNGSVQDFIMNCDGCYIEFVYMGATTGWISTK
jgi:hypothetical protein